MNELIELDQEDYMFNMIWLEVKPMEGVSYAYDLCNVIGISVNSCIWLLC